MNSIHLIPISGRPNSGKTSLINYLCHTKKPVGKRAGTTTKISFIPLVSDLFIVDLPGYGRILKRSRKFEDYIKNEIIRYFDEPTNHFLFGIHIIDISTFHHMVQNLEKKGIIPIDVEMIQFIAKKTNIPPLVVFNKIDKMKNTAVEQNLALLQSYELPEIEIFILSIRTKKGCQSFRNRVKRVIFEELGTKYQNW